MDSNMLFTPKRKKKKHSYFRTLDVIFLVIVTCVVTFNMSYIFFLFSRENSDFVSGDHSSHINKFIQEYNKIVDGYYDELDEDKLIDGAIKGLIDSLPDDYSSTLDSSEINNYDTHLKGTYEGIGVEIINNVETGDIYIHSIIENSPAEKTELKAGDRIISVNGTNVEKQPTTVFVELVKDSKEKEFVIVAEREGKEIKATLKKGLITLQSVTSEVLDMEGKNYGYMDISIFAENTDEQFKQQLETLEASNIEGLIIDVRSNGGGYLSSVTNMLSLFIDKSKILYQTEQNGKVQKILSDKPGEKIYDIVVLIDGGSASASEILAAGLSEQCGAKLVGRTSYGKGTVQELVTLADGSQYKYTTKKWLTPKGNWIDGKGIIPNYDVPLDEEYSKTPTRENDDQFQKALEVIKN